MRDQRGLTLAEVLIAIAVIAVGLTAIAMGFGIATTGAETGRQQTVALLLAEQRIEQLRSRILADFSDAVVSPGTTREGYASIPNGAGYRRQTAIGDLDPDGDGVTDMKRVTVDVFYRPITERGTLQTEHQVTLVNIVSRRR
jgi:prepilin-type N-terminal cleavage/methylation domain-containing protein